MRIIYNRQGAQSRCISSRSLLKMIVFWNCFWPSPPTTLSFLTHPNKEIRIFIHLQRPCATDSFNEDRCICLPLSHPSSPTADQISLRVNKSFRCIMPPRDHCFEVVNDIKRLPKRQWLPLMGKQCLETRVQICEWTYRRDVLAAALYEWVRRSIKGKDEAKVDH